MLRGSQHVVGIYGGLGNQLFQYSWSRYLSRYMPVRYDLSGLRGGVRDLELDALGLQVRANSLKPTALFPFPGGRLDGSAILLRRIMGPQSIIIEEKAGGIANPARPSWWYGYWQDRAVALDSIVEIRASLPAGDFHSRSVGIHVRRGDFVHLGLSLPPTYFVQALAQLNAKYTDLERAVIYSDDVAWCRSNLALDIEMSFTVAGGPGADMLSLSAHEYLILSRGTFGWWSSYLRARDPDTVVAPDSYLPGEGLKEEMLVDPGWQRAPVVGLDRRDGQDD